MFEIEEDEKKGGDDIIQTQPSASSTHAPCVHLVLLFRLISSILIKYRVTKTFSKCSLTCRVAIVRDPVTLAAEDPQEYEERTVMILEPSKK